jgi:drug/metabolite transporter (DMT)-like permease
LATLRHWIVLILLAAIWGSSFILIKRALYALDGSEIFTSTQVGSLRISIAALFLAPIALSRLKLLRKGMFKYFLVVGLCGNALPAFLFAKAQTQIPSALAGMLNALTPVFALIIGLVVFKVRVKTIQVLGIVIGVIAAAGLLLGSDGLKGADLNVSYAMLAVAAAFLYGISLNTMKQYLQNEPAVAITSLALLLVSPIGFITLFTTDFTEKMATLPGAWYALGAVTILAVLGTAIALILFNKLVQDTNAIFASSVTYLIPLVAIVWGMADGESLSTLQLICAPVMIAGILLINRK